MRCTVALALLLTAGCGSKNNGNDMAVGGNGSDDLGPNCGNGVIDLNEDCDNGADNGTAGNRCSEFCQFVCAVDVNCDDGKPCNGTETCVDHACKPGTPLGDGEMCGAAMLCRGGTCVASRCGDGIVTAPEECDDGNVTDGDGCDSSCKFSCKSSDPARNCTPPDACAGQGTCNDTTHKCAAGTALGDGTACGTGNDYCKGGHCTMPMCGNNMKEPGEDCDDGGLNGTKGDGCTTGCKYACVNPVTDCGTPPVCEKWSCTTAHVCLAIPDAAQNGMACGSMLVCKDGSCAAATAVCGNGIKETGEDCDFGSGNGPNTGCEASTCKFSCANAGACDDGNACNGAETCDSVTVGSAMGQKCNPGTALTDGTACGTAKVCISKICQNSTCGDNVIDPRTENCDPPGSMIGGEKCDSHCHLIHCGDSLLEDTEQCDDGNLINLDGCDNKCQFEQDARANFLDMSYDTTICNPNQLGGGLNTTLGKSSVSGSLATGIKNGTINIMMKLVGLDDLTGTSSTKPFSLGFVNSTVVTGGTYDGTMDLDWWYTVDPLSVDGNRNPTTSLMNGKFVASVLSADTGTLILNIVLAGSPGVLTMYNSKIGATVDLAATTPTMSSGSTPGHLASEHLLPTLKSFPSVKGGTLCGNITAKSLDAVTMPMALQGLICIPAFYGATDKLLDAVVNGCSTALGTAIKPTQPDGSVDGNHYTFTSTNGRVTGCTGGAAWPTCLDKATYSSSFLFTADRVIAK